MFAVLAWVGVLRAGSAANRDDPAQAGAGRIAQEGRRTGQLARANSCQHEPRDQNPLNGILGFSGLMAEGPLNGDQRDLQRSRTRLGGIPAGGDQRHLDFSRIEAGRMELESTDFSLRQCVTAALCPYGRWRAAKAFSWKPGSTTTCPIGYGRTPTGCARFSSTWPGTRSSSPIRAESRSRYRWRPAARGADRSIRRGGHRHRHPRIASRGHLPAVPPGRRIDYPAFWGHRAGPRDCQQADRSDERPDLD